MSKETLSHNFDKLVEKQIGNNNRLIPGTVYFDESYENDLRNEMGYVICKKLKKEFNRSEVISGVESAKICSIASSARLCYFYLKNVPNIEFEYTKLKNKKCKPNFDAYADNVYYECKCHEFYGGRKTIKFVKSYNALFKQYFHKEFEVIDDHIYLTYSDFNINLDTKIKSTPFDFKQFLCHIFGLLKILDSRPTLKYLLFSPEEEVLKEDSKVYERYKEIIEITNKVKDELKVFIGDKEVFVKDIINIVFEFVPIKQVKDTIV